MSAATEIAYTICRATYSGRCGCRARTEEDGRQCGPCDAMTNAANGVIFALGLTMDQADMLYSRAATVRKKPGKRGDV